MAVSFFLFFFFFLWQCSVQNSLGKFFYSFTQWWCIKWALTNIHVASMWYSCGCRLPWPCIRGASRIGWTWYVYFVGSESLQGNTSYLHRYYIISAVILHKDLVGKKESAWSVAKHLCPFDHALFCTQEESVSLSDPLWWFVLAL